MAELSDRLLILLVAATGLLVFVLGWTGGLVEAGFAGWAEAILFGVLGVVFLAILVGIWMEFNRIE